MARLTWGGMLTCRVPRPSSVDGKVLELQVYEAQYNCVARHASLVCAATVCWVLRPDLPRTVGSSCIVSKRKHSPCCLARTVCQNIFRPSPKQA